MVYEMEGIVPSINEDDKALSALGGQSAFMSMLNMGDSFIFAGSRSDSN